jgi:HSP20 family molecular chaperone IbpA
MARAQKPEVPPEACVDHDREKYHIEVELPGVAKEKIELEFGEESFCVRAPRGDLVFNACYTLGHPVDMSKVDARFDSGLLKVTVPFKQPIAGTKVQVK